MDDLLRDHIAIFLLALVIDLTIGEPKEGTLWEKMHPVVWMGAIYSYLDRNIARNNPLREKFAGALAVLLVAIIFSIPCVFLFLIKNELVYVLVSAVILKTTISIKTLGKYAKRTLTGDIETKRREVSKIVGRNTKNLDNGHLNSATIESVAENLTDSVISPMFYFVFLGVAGAVFYRVVNTGDSMLGYKNRKYRYVGWFAAKLDTVMNYVPERIASVLIYCRRMKKHKNVPKTIVAMSYFLKVKLEKVCYYTVNDNLKMPDDISVLKAIKVMECSSLVFTAICIIIMLYVFC